MQLEAGENPNPEAEPALLSLWIEQGTAQAQWLLGCATDPLMQPCKGTAQQRQQDWQCDLHTLEGSTGDKVTVQKVGHLPWLLLLPWGLSFQAALLGCSVTA